MSDKKQDEAEMLKNLDLLLQLEVLENESAWSEIEKATETNTPTNTEAQDAQNE